MRVHRRCVCAVAGKVGQWAPSYAFAVHAMREACRYGQFRRSVADLCEFKPEGSALVGRRIPNLLDARFTGAWASIGTAAIRSSMRFIVALQCLVSFPPTLQSCTSFF